MTTPWLRQASPTRWALVWLLVAEMLSLSSAARPILDHGALLDATAGQAETAFHKLNASSDNEGAVATRTGTRCGFTTGPDGEILPDGVELSWDDVRVGLYNRGFFRGMAARIGQFGTILVGTRVIPVEMSPAQALEAIFAVYGILYVEVPKKCFDEIYANLDNKADRDKDDFDFYTHIRERRTALRTLILNEVKYECVPKGRSGRGKTKAGRAAFKKLTPLRWGYWTLYKPLTTAIPDPDSDDEPPSKWFIAAQVTDPIRFVNGDFSLRQIWFYTRMYLNRGLLPNMLRGETDLIYDVDTSGLTRTESMIHEDEKRALKIQLKRLTRAHSLQYGMLVQVEIGGLDGKCIAAPWDGDDTILEDFMTQLSGLKFTLYSRNSVTLLFRERWAGGTVTGFVKFMSHPLVSLGKWVDRKSTEWHEVGTFGKIAMIITPVLKLASAAGIVLGVVTAGQSTLISLICGAIVKEGAMAVALAGTAFIDFILGQMISRVTVPAAYEAIIEMENFDTMIKLWAYFDGVPEIEQLRFLLDREFEDIYHSDEVQATMKQVLGEDGHDGDEDNPFSVEESVQRIFYDTLGSNWAAEVGPHIQTWLEKYSAEHHPDWGWLKWNDWAAFRGEGKFTDIATRSIEYTSPDIPDGCSSTEFEKLWGHGPVKVQERKPTLSGPTVLRIVDKVRFPGGADVLLTDGDLGLKKGLRVYDPEAYRKSQAGWLSFSIWDHYAGGTPKSFKSLANGREIRIDPDRFGMCSTFTEEDFPKPKQLACALSLMSKDSADGAWVTSVWWPKILASYRWKTISFRTFQTRTDLDLPFSSKCTIPLTSKMEVCLLVKDPDVYGAYDEDQTKLKKMMTVDDSLDMSSTDVGDDDTSVSSEWSEIELIVQEIQGTVEAKLLETGDDDPVKQGELTLKVLEDETGGSSIQLDTMLDTSPPDPDLVDEDEVTAINNWLDFGLKLSKSMGLRISDDVVTVLDTEDDVIDDSGLSKHVDTGTKTVISSSSGTKDNQR